MHRAKAIAPILAGLILVCLSASAQAHKPLLSVEDNSDGSIAIEAGFSDGSSAAGHKIILKNEKTGEVLSKHSVGEDGTLQLKIPSVPYTVTLDAGEGHTATQRGPAVPRSESVATPKEGEALKMEPVQPAPTEAPSATPQSQTGGTAIPPKVTAQPASDARTPSELTPGAVMAFKMMITAQIVTATVLIVLLSVIVFFVGYTIGQRNDGTGAHGK